MAAHLFHMIGHVTMHGMHEFHRNMKAAEVATTTFAGKMTAMGHTIGHVGAGLTKNLSLPLALAGAAIIKTGADFDRAVTKSLAPLGDTVTPKLRREFEDLAIQLSQETTFSAAEVADAFYYLVTAGVSAEKAMATLGVVTEFAEAGNLDLALATENLTDVVGALGLDVDNTTQYMENMAHVSDVVTKASTIADATIGQFTESLMEAGGTMNILGVDIEEGTAALAGFAKTGLKGQRAGYALMMVMRDLAHAAANNSEEFEKAGVHVFDANGKFNDLTTIIDQLTEHFQGLSHEQRVNAIDTLGLNKRLSQYLFRLISVNGEIQEYREKLEDVSGFTKEVAEANVQDFYSQLEILWSHIQAVALILWRSLGPALKNYIIPALTIAVGVVKAVADEFDKWHPIVKNVVWALLAFMTLLGPMMMAIGGVMSAIGYLTAKWHSLLYVLWAAKYYITIYAIPAFKALTAYILTSVIPAVKLLFAHLLAHPFRTLSAFLLTRVIPAFKALGAYILTSVIPAFKLLFAFLLAHPIVAVIAAVAALIAWFVKLRSETGSTSAALASMAVAYLNLTKSILEGMKKLAGIPVLGEALGLIGFEDVIDEGLGHLNRWIAGLEKHIQKSKESRDKTKKDREGEVQDHKDKTDEIEADAEANQRTLEELDEELTRQLKEGEGERTGDAQEGAQNRKDIAWQESWFRIDALRAVTQAMQNEMNRQLGITMQNGQVRINALRMLGNQELVDAIAVSDQKLQARRQREEEWTAKVREQGQSRIDELKRQMEEELANENNTARSRFLIRQYYENEIRKETRRTAWEIVQTGISTLNTLMSEWSQYTSARIQQIQAASQREITAIQNSKMSETQKQQHIQRIQGRTDARVRGLQRAQARREKAMAIFNAIILGAQAVVRVWSQLGIFGHIAAIAIGAMTAAQVALIAARPIPFAKGGLVKSGKKGGVIAQVGEGKEDEVVFPLETGIKALVTGLIKEVNGLSFDKVPMQTENTTAGISAHALQRDHSGRPAATAVDNNTYSPTHHWHVGVLVADERGIKELERRQAKYRISENQRKGKY